VKRRALLAASLGSSLVLSGCLGDTQDQQGEGTTVEVIPTNQTDREVTLDVSVTATDGTTLLDHTYSLPAGESDESQGVPNRVDSLVVTRGDGEAVRHDYDPDVEICSRDGEDVNLAVRSDTIEFSYSC
jgi:hypothetical protein